MVFDQRPDELFASVVQRGLETFRNTIEGVSQVIRTGDQTVRELDDALTGSRPKFGETPQETFTTVLDMLEGTLVEAREKGSAAAPSVTQHAREILGRINAVEPAWRQGPVSLRTAPDIFRSALRDLRGSNSLIRLAQGQGSLTDLDGLSKWADDLKERLGQVKSPAQSTQVPAATEPTPKARKKKEATEEIFNGTYQDILDEEDLFISEVSKLVPLG